MTTKKRQCKKCDETKNLTDFDINNRTIDANGNEKVYRKHTCTDCRNHQKATLRRLHKENPKPESITCPVCLGDNKEPVLDHCHHTDTFRGWTCDDCNNGSGKFNDDITTIKRLLAYLEG